MLCVKRSNEPTPLAGEPLSVTSGLRHQCDVSVFLGQLNPHDNFFLRLVVNGRIGDDLIDALRGHYIANVASGCRYVCPMH